MTILISGTNIEITEAIKTHINQQFEKIQAHFPRITKMSVVISLDGSQQKAEGNIHFDGLEFHAEALTTDLYTSINQVAEKLEHQLTKHKEKIIDSHR